MSDQTETQTEAAAKAGPDRIAQLVGVVAGVALGAYIANQAVTQNGNGLFGAGILGVLLGLAVGFMAFKFVIALKSFLSGEMIDGFEKFNRIQRNTEAERKAAAAARRAAATEASRAAAAARSAAASAAKAEPVAAASDRPAGTDEPRGGEKDDLKRIKGVGPKLEALLNTMGYWHFDQIAAWTEAEVAWVDANLEGFKGRVTRDGWVAQARALAAEG